METILTKPAKIYNILNCMKKYKIDKKFVFFFLSLYHKKMIFDRIVELLQDVNRM